MKCKEYVKLEIQEHVMDQWNNMMYSNTEDRFDVHLKHFESVCGDIPSFVNYVKETWLTPYKEIFVAAWTNRVPRLRNTITNRVESAHLRLKNMLTTSRGDLCASWDAVNTMLKLRKELKRVKFVGASKQRCGCYIRTTHGLPCACQLVGYQILGIPIPLESIHVFWTKLQISEYEVSPDGSKWDLEEECEELKRQFNTMDIVAQRALKKKVCDLAYPSTSLMCSSLVKYKPKRGAKKSRKGEESDVHRDPSQWEYADASQGSLTTKRSSTQPSGIQSSSTMLIGKQPSTNSAKGKYLSQFPAFYHPYIDDIVDVKPDGNCGFSCISSALGWGKMHVTMFEDSCIL
ncbi:uncharacterized protein LOC131658740 [Vicia villosa]|uniref:uncharacterized protein LOC131658740 n=1 Tax=Vicia villosa TaxID=3911 RepID=UPI00273B5C1D|nr:uncharacterized protein LOC131658740 [Vicia villosa]